MYENYKKDLSYLYNIGYRTGLRDIRLFIRKFSEGKSESTQQLFDEIFSAIMNNFNKYPLIKKINESEIESMIKNIENRLIENGKI